MGSAKTQPTDTPLTELIATIGDDRRRTDAAHVAAIMERATSQPPVVWGTALVGFGTYETPTGPWPAVAMAARKQAVVLYLGECGERERLLAELGRHTLGKGCVYVPDLSAVDVVVLEELIRASYAARTTTD